MGINRILVIAGLLVVIASGCLKSDKVEPCVVKTLEQDKAAMTPFAADSSITEEANGILYKIITPGNATRPAINSLIVAKYVGKNLSGVQFDAGQFNQPIALSELIPGWQIIMPKIGVGGRVKMVIPSSLAYGCRAPARDVYNQPLYFDVELVSVQ